jgi:hypothetical protein
MLKALDDVSRRQLGSEWYRVLARSPAIPAGRLNPPLLCSRDDKPIYLHRPFGIRGTSIASIDLDLD